MLNNPQITKYPSSGFILYNPPNSNTVAYFDCDCLAMPFPVEPEPEVFDANHVYYLAPSLQSYPILFEQDTYYAVFIPSQSKIAVFDALAYKMLMSYIAGASPQSQREIWGERVIKLTQMCIELGFLSVVPLIPLKTAKKQKEPLSAWLHVTNDCNLDCSYCYIDKSHQDMSWEKAQQAIDMLIRTAVRHDYESIVIKYAGGEPTLRLSFIERIHQYLHKQVPVGITVRETILTNGVGLTRHRARLIKSLGINLTISLDGLGTTHDKQRPTKDGRGSSEYVRKSILNAKAMGLDPAISLTVTHQSTPTLADTIDWILAQGCRFNIHYYRDHEVGQSISEMRINEKKLIDNMRLVMQRIEANLPPQSLLNALVDYSDISSARQRSCLAGSSYLVIGHRGNISSCQMLMMQADATVDDEEPLSKIREKNKEFFVDVDDKEGCQECEWRYWCRGGCPVQTFRATGRTDIKSPDCSIYKSLFPDVIRLEALRLLRRGELIQQGDNS